jgi:hypothetical protein
MIMKADQACTEPHGGCASLPDLVRMNYFHGQLIGDRDLRTDQEYFRARLRHANRCLHGYGVLCGLEVQPVPDDKDCPPKGDERSERLREKIAEIDSRIKTLSQKGADAAKDEIREMEAEREALARELEALGASHPDHADGNGHRAKHVIALGCGAAIDCDGNDIIVRQTVPVDLDDLIKCASRDEAGHDAEGREDDQASGEDGEGRYVYLSICYRECGREPTRPFEMDECATSVRCHDARVAEGWRLTASWRRPAEDERCETCCTPCRDPCLLLARIRVDRARQIGAGDIDHSVRRRFGLYDPSVITGINWRQGAVYSPRVANLLIGTDDKAAGLEIRFSRPVRRGSLVDGVVDLLRVTGRGGISGVIVSMEAEYVGLPDDPLALVDRVHVRTTNIEGVQRNDRIIIVVRTAFILDACCRPVEGSHIGGRVPRLPGISETDKAAIAEEGSPAVPDECVHPPHGPVPWTTGAGGNFESWFYISDK